MKSTKSMKDKGPALRPTGESFILLTGCFLYFWLWVNPALIYQTQEPVFFFGSGFLADFLTRPGGLVEYSSAFLSQFYYFPAAGALVLAVVCWLASVALGLLFSFCKPVKANRGFLIIPAVLLLGLSSIYNNNLAFNIGFVATLFLFALYLKSAAIIPALRWLFFLLLAVVDYYLAGGFLILFLLLYGSFLVFNYKNFPDVLVALIMIPIPWITAKYLSLVSLRDACFYFLPEKVFTVTGVITWALWIYIIAVMVVGWLLQRKTTPDAKDGKQNYIININNRTIAAVVQGGIVVIIIIVTLFFTINPRYRIFLKTNYLARHNMWQKLIDLQTENKYTSLYEIYEVNRALYHSGSLLDEMFTFPQNWGIESLCLSMRFTDLTPLHESDIDYDLGYYNESLHWAYEAVSIKGETGWNLQRLAILHILKGEKNSARRCLGNLVKTVPFRGWAEHYLTILDNDSLLLADPLLQEKYKRIIKIDFMNVQDKPVANLERLLQADPANKMAFEYYMAASLLNRHLDTIIKNIPKFRELGYSQLPRHIQEAILIYMAQNRISTLDVSGYSMNSKVKAQFSAFQQAMSRFKNKEAAQASMYESFNRTYWYYALYPPRLQSNEATAR